MNDGLFMGVVERIDAGCHAVDERGMERVRFPVASEKGAQLRTEKRCQRALGQPDGLVL